MRHNKKNEDKWLCLLLSFQARLKFGVLAYEVHSCAKLRSLRKAGEGCPGPAESVSLQQSLSPVSAQNRAPALSPIPWSKLSWLWGQFSSPETAMGNMVEGGPCCHRDLGTLPQT